MCANVKKNKTQLIAAHVGHKRAHPTRSLTDDATFHGAARPATYHISDSTFASLVRTFVVAIVLLARSPRLRRRVGPVLMDAFVFRLHRIPKTLESFTVSSPEDQTALSVIALHV